MKTIYLLYCTFFLQVSSILSQVEPNSRRFEVKNYIAIDNSGKYAPYFTHGFAEVTPNGTRSKLFILPLLEMDLKQIAFIDSQGLRTSSSSNEVASITIPVSANFSLPNESQKAAIGASLDAGANLSFFQPPLAKNNFGGPVINPNAGIYTGQIMAQANQYEQSLSLQQKYIDAYNQYVPEIITLQEYEVIVKVGNLVVYDENFPGTLISMGGSLDDISIDNPSTSVKNRIASGDFTVMIKYKFRNSKVGYIDASINASSIINQFLRETQESTVSQSSSGWSFLGFGSSRKSFKSHFEQQMDQQLIDNRISGTTIEMNDADEDMISLFEDAFFPKISEQKAIENHIAAAEKAKSEGNTELQKLHLDYARALQTNDPNLQVDIEKATAALSQKDYVGFIAHGVRWGERQGKGSYSFRRVLNSSELTQMESYWKQTKRISVMHAVTQKVSISNKVTFRASLGLINLISYQSNMYLSNGFTGQWRNIRGIILGPVTLGGTLHQCNITPGSLLTAIGSRNVYDAQTLDNALNQFSPGETVTLTLIEPIGPNVFRENFQSVVLGAYPVVK